MKYQVQLIQTREAFVDVEADSVEEAYEKASEGVTEDHWQLQGCENGEIASNSLRRSRKMNESLVKIKAAIEVVEALAKTIRDLGEVPEGVLYVRVMNYLSPERFDSIIRILRNSQLIKVENHLITWIGPNDESRAS